MSDDGPTSDAARARYRERVRRRFEHDGDAELVYLVEQMDAFDTRLPIIKEMLAERRDAAVERQRRERVADEREAASLAAAEESNRINRESLRTASSAKNAAWAAAIAAIAAAIFSGLIFFLSR